MAKLWKHLVLIAGILGIVGIFTPLIETRTKAPVVGQISIELTAYQLTFGLARTHKVLDYKIPAKLEKQVDKYLGSTITDAKSDAKLVAEASRYAVLLFVPALCLLALGLYALIKQRFGRVVATLTLVAGALSLAAYFGLGAGIEYGMKEAGFKRTTVEAIAASYMLLVAGILGLVAGLGGLVQPQHPTVRKPRAPQQQPFTPHAPPPPGPAPGGPIYPAPH